MIDFKGQVALVTGAGQGMGRCHAIALAKRGAKVVVNDMVADLANAVTEEIVAFGGEAVANTIKQGTAQAARDTVKAVLDAYGRLDILINNAGVLGEGPFADTPDEFVEEVMSSNLYGEYWLVRAVWPVMIEQNYGRIVNISSNAAIGCGNNGPYAVSKAGVTGLTFEAAITGKEYNILCNAIWPCAATQMTLRVPETGVIDEEFAKKSAQLFRDFYPPERVTAVAVYLASKECDKTGEIISAAGGRVARAEWIENKGVFNAEMEPEDVPGIIEEATDMSDASSLSLITDVAKEAGLIMAMVSPATE